MPEHRAFTPDSWQPPAWYKNINDWEASSSGENIWSFCEKIFNAFTDDHTLKSFILGLRISRPRLNVANDTRGTERRNMGRASPNILWHQTDLQVITQGDRWLKVSPFSPPGLYLHHWQGSGPVTGVTSVTWVMGSFMTRTSVTLPNWPKYSLSRSWLVCQLRPPTNSLPGAESELGVLRPLDSPCNIQVSLNISCLAKLLSCPQSFLQLVKFEPRLLPVPTQLKVGSFPSIFQERRLNNLYPLLYFLVKIFSRYFHNLPAIRYHLKRAGAGAARRAGPSSVWNDKMISAPKCQGSPL